MKIFKTILRCILILFCLVALFTQGLFSVPGLFGLIVAILALPVPPVAKIWNYILPPDSPRWARGAILAAAFLVILAAIPWPFAGTTGADDPVPVAVEATAEPTAEPTKTPETAATPTPSPTPAPTVIPSPSPAPTATPEPTETPAPAATASMPAETQPSADGREATPQTEPSSDAAYTAPQSDTVYIAGSGKGKKYHRDPGCSNMNNPVPLTQAEAEARGYTPCKKCYG